MARQLRAQHPERVAGDGGAVDRRHPVARSEHPEWLEADEGVPAARAGPVEQRGVGVTGDDAEEVDRIGVGDLAGERRGGGPRPGR